MPRVRRHRASKPQGSSKRMLPWQVTIMDQLIRASRYSHTHYWYEVGTLNLVRFNSWDTVHYSAILVGTTVIPIRNY